MIVLTNPSTAARNASVSPCLPPSCWMMSFIAGESSRPTTLLAIEPIRKAMTAEPAVHATSSGRCSRHARPTGELRAPAAGPGRSRSSPEPRSRRRRKMNATGISRAVAASGSTNTDHRSPAKARICWFHPIGDLANEGPGWLSWLSPIGWNQQIRAFAGDRWSVLVLPLAATALLMPVAFILRRRRDLGSGLLRDRPGPAAGALSSPIGLAWRLQRPLLVAWTAGSAVLAFMMGSIANNVAGLLDSPAMKDIIQQLGGKQGLTDAFLAAVLGLVSTIIAAYGISAVGRLHTEEAGGHAESVLATAIFRMRPPDRRDPVGGDDRADQTQDRGQERISQALLATELLDDVFHRRGVQQARDVVGDGAHHEGQDGRARRPRNQQWALQPPREADWGAQGPSRGAGPVAQQP